MRPNPWHSALSVEQKDALETKASSERNGHAGFVTGLQHGASRNVMATLHGMWAPRMAQDTALLVSIFLPFSLPVPGNVPAGNALPCMA